jgi:hypothetical protein
MTTKTTTRTTKKTAKAARPAHRAPGSAGILEQLAAACRRRPAHDDQRDAIDRAAGAAVELVALLRARGVTFAAPDRAPEQIAASILATYQLAAAGPRDADADFLLVASGVVDGLKHALTSADPADRVAFSILAPGAARGGAR